MPTTTTLETFRANLAHALSNRVPVNIGGVKVSRKQLEVLAAALEPPPVDTRAIEQAASLAETGRCTYAALVEMVAALECDYERLEELREERDTFTGDFPEGSEIAATEAWNATAEGEELAQLAAEAGDCTDQDDARQRIAEDALSIEVRGDWRTPGEEAQVVPSEFKILLTTGGPAVQIRGELDDYGQPSRAVGSARLGHTVDSIPGEMD